MSIAFLPKKALADKSLADSGKVILCVLMTESEGGCCTLSNPAIAKLVGKTVTTVRETIDSLRKSGWIEVDESGKARSISVYLSKQDAYTPSAEEYIKDLEDMEKKDVFHPDNLNVSDEAIASLIDAFVKSGVNPNVQSESIRKTTFASPFNRKAAREIIRAGREKRAKELLEILGKRRGEEFCPVVRSLSMLMEKWEKAENFAAGKWKRGPTIDRY